MQSLRLLFSLLFLPVLFLPNWVSGEDGDVVKKVIVDTELSANLLVDGGWLNYEQGFDFQDNSFVCDNGDASNVAHGATQSIVLDQTQADPIIASVESRCEAIEGSANSDYSLYLDLVFIDGTTLWGQTAVFDGGTHDWQRREVVIHPNKPVRQVSVYLMLRNRPGKAWFRNPRLGVVKADAGGMIFDGVPVQVVQSPATGFQVRDVAASSDFVQIEHSALGLELDHSKTSQADAVFLDVRLTNTTGKDRAITLLYAVNINSSGATWLEDPRSGQTVQPRREYCNAEQFHVGAGGRISRYPFAAVATQERGVGLGIDMAYPAVYRAGYNSGTNELFLAVDLGLTAEKPTASLRLVGFQFDPGWGFRSALSVYYQTFPENFHCRTPKQGLWMPFAKISQIEGWEDFGFQFKEGNEETQWDDQHHITTFRYTEPLTWWMPMPPAMPRTISAALAEAKRLAKQEKVPLALAFQTSGFVDATGQPTAQLLDTPWSKGAVWSMNDMPGIKGKQTGFNVKWNRAIRDQFYGSDTQGRLDGEYIDSSEGYVTAELDYRREHFAAASTPLTFSMNDHRPAIFRGLISYEYIRGIAHDVHKLDRLMMANSTPDRHCWLAPLLDVMGTETDWHRAGQWQPMSDSDMLYRRAICKGKPYCLLMNSDFKTFSHELVERYMQRCLAYGMFPGFFSHNASEGHYFSQPQLYNRDRELFKKFVPLCKMVAEAGWEPISLARSNQPQVYVERFGERYLTVFNDSAQKQDVVIELDTAFPHQPTGLTTELVKGDPVQWTRRRATITLASQAVAVLDFADRK
jgi:hypothetical protein